MALTTANPAMGSMVPGYDPVSQQNNVAAMISPAFSDPNTSIKYGPLLSDQIKAATLAGAAFSATSGILATATNANVFIAMGLLASAIAKNILIYRINAELEQATTGAVRLTQATTLDATITAAVTPLNNNLGSSATSLATIKSTANANTSPTVTSGTLRQVNGSVANPNLNIELLQQGSVIFIPAGSTQGVTAWVLAPTAGNTAQICMEYLEF
jgi:hypothetical protein